MSSEHFSGGAVQSLAVSIRLYTFHLLAQQQHWPLRCPSRTPRRKGLESKGLQQAQVGSGNQNFMPRVRPNIIRARCDYSAPPPHTHHPHILRHSLPYFTSDKPRTHHHQQLAPLYAQHLCRSDRDKQARSLRFLLQFEWLA